MDRKVRESSRFRVHIASCYYAEVVKAIISSNCKIPKIDKVNLKRGRIEGNMIF